MASTLAKLKQASVEPIYDFLDFSDFYPTKTGRIRYRVNLSKKMKDEVFAISDENKAIAAILENPNVTAEERQEAEARQLAANERSLALNAALIMADDEKGNESLTLEQWKEWITSERDEEDSKFTAWVQNEIFRRVTEYLSQSFLSRERSRQK